MTPTPALFTDTSRLRRCHCSHRPAPARPPAASVRGRALPRWLPAVVVALALHPATAASVAAGERPLQVGAATVDITPDQPVALAGQRHVRISREPETPIIAVALALDTGDGSDGAGDHAIMVACDLVAIRDGIAEAVREKAAARLPAVDPDKIFLSATHTHTAPVMREGRYELPDDIMQPDEYADWMTSRIADAVVEAWENRAPGKVAWGQGQAVVAQNRRPYFANGTAVMYGNPDSPDFRGIEAYEDHSVDILYFWDGDDQMIATVINLPCPAQEVGGGSRIHADFWHPVRLRLQEEHGDQLNVLGWTGASGDVTSRLIINRPADERIRQLRGNVSRLDEIARRIVHAWTDTLEAAANDIRGEVVFKHHVRTIELPMRQVTDEEHREAEREAARFADDPAQRWNHLWHQRVVDRHQAQQAGEQEPYRMRLNALRLGDVAIATNPFELYTDFGIQMKARSPAVQTFVVQLTGPGSYLPTERAVELGGYGAVIQSSQVGPDGGQVLVDKTVEAWRGMWEE